MLSFFLSDANFWFSCALGIVAALFVMEVVGTLMGISLLGLADDQVDFDADAVASAGSLTALASWLSLDRLPLMVWLVILLTSFGIIGILTTMVSQSATGGHFPGFIVVTISVIAALIIPPVQDSAVAMRQPVARQSLPSSSAKTRLRAISVINPRIRKFTHAHLHAAHRAVRQHLHACSGT